MKQITSHESTLWAVVRLRITAIAFLLSCPVVSLFAQSSDGEVKPGPEKSTSVGAFVIKEPAQAESEKSASSTKPTGKITVICSKCGKEVSVDAEYGQKCPHCGIEWVMDVEVPEPRKPMNRDPAAASADSPWLPDNSGADPQRNRPAGGQGHADQGGGQVRPAPAHGGGPIQLDVPPPPPVNGGVTEDISLSNLPLWLKTLLFVGAAGGLYYVLFYVR